MSVLIYFFTSFLDYTVNDVYIPQYKKTLASILPTIAMSRSLALINVYESAGVGLQMSNIGEVYDNYQVSVAFYMFVIGLVLSTSTGLYLTNVLPISPVGLRKPWYYPCRLRFWLDGYRKRQRKN